MKIAMISFTGNGRRLERSLAHELEKEGHQVLQAVKCKELESDKDAVKCSAREWTGEQFRTRDVLIFIGAVQIAVRLIASFIGSKTTDPAVLVLDEKGQYCIPILSGHIGGANEMAERIAEMAGALPVITTATDIRGKWAIDVFARKNHLYIEDMQKAKQISAKILEEWENNRESFKECGMSKSAYEAWKDKTLAYYASQGVEMSEFEDLDEDERIKRRAALLSGE